MGGRESPCAIHRVAHPWLSVKNTPALRNPSLEALPARPQTQTLLLACRVAAVAGGRGVGGVSDCVAHHTYVIVCWFGAGVVGALPQPQHGAVECCVLVTCEARVAHWVIRRPRPSQPHATHHHSAHSPCHQSDELRWHRLGFMKLKAIQQIEKADLEIMRIIKNLI